MKYLAPLIFTDQYKSIGIIYEDNHVLVVHKPRNIPVQADSSLDESLQLVLQTYLKDKYQKPGNVFLGIVHRLDRPVSGIMVFAKTSKAASRLSEQMRNHAFKKMYLAIVKGIPSPKGTFINLLKKNSDTNIVSVVQKQEKDAQLAELSYEVIQSNGKSSLMLINLKTGRPHQIRVQFSYHNFPILGDGKYGNEVSKSSQLELKSCFIEFEHPTTKEILSFSGIINDSQNWKDFHK
jgi:23S rRNA pseudouridine1911/1915/1917 synthase